MKNFQTGLTIFLCVFLSLLPIHAEKVNAERAGKIAQHYLHSKRQFSAGDAVRLKYAVTQKPRMGRASVVLPDDVSVSGVQDTVFYYVFDVHEDANGGFVIISGDDAVTPVLGYSDKGYFDENNLPANFVYWMDYLQQQIRWTMSQNQPQNEIIRQKWDHYQNGNTVGNVASSVSPLISTKWNQNAPYWNQCPKYLGHHCYTGCVATAMAQIMNFHCYPALGFGHSEAYKTKTLGISVPSVNFGIPYDWNNMSKLYSGSNPIEQENAVATLMYHCGVSVKMNYTPDGSGAYSFDVPKALTSFFSYDKSIQIKYRTHYDDNSWDAMLKEQIDAGLPMYYAGSGSVGHAFVCDGYDGDLFHFNWGWGGSCDGFFVTSALIPGEERNYSEEQEIVINIKPDAGGVSAGYIIGLYDVFTSTATSAQTDEPFQVSVKIENAGWEEFPGGKLGVALVDSNEQIVETVGTYANTLGKLQAGAYFPITYNIACKIPDSVTKGQYRLKVVTKPTDGNWKIATLSANCPVHIDFLVVGTTIAVTDVTLNKTSTTIVVGNSEQLSANVLPVNASKRIVTWNSSNTAVATVSSNGLVTGVSAGTAIITVTSQDGEKKANCMVTVTSVVSNDASLAEILVNNRFAVPVQGSATSWEITVEYTTSIAILATPNHSGANIQQGHQGVKIVNVGTNIIDIMVTAENGHKVNHILVVTVKDLQSKIGENTEQHLKAYPNPMRDRLIVCGLEGSSIITLTDATGRQWIKQISTSEEKTIERGGIPAGIYFLQVIEAKKTRAIKIIVE